MSGCGIILTLIVSIAVTSKAEIHSEESLIRNETSHDDNNGTQHDWVKEFRDLGWDMADKARFHAVSHHDAADWYGSRDTCLTYASIFLGACSAVGAGNSIFKLGNNRVSNVFTAVTAFVQSMITALNSCQYSPKKLRDDHHKAAVELQYFRAKLKVWYLVDIYRPGMAVEMAKEDYYKFVDEAKRIASEYIESEKWNFPLVNEEILQSDNRKDKAKDKEL